MPKRTMPFQVSGAASFFLKFSPEKIRIMIEIKGLKKSFGALNVLKDIDLAIEDGDIYGLVGKSGVGKSTLLRCINGLETYDAGSLQVDGVEIGSLSKNELRLYRKNVAMIFQHFALMSRKTVYDNIAFPMQCWKYGKKHIDAKVHELAEVVGIQDQLKQKSSTLSGGQKQRVAIARALVMGPKLLLCDEATSSLDPATTGSILQLLREINESLGITIIVVTHQMAVVREVCRNVSLLRRGRVSVSGRVVDLFRNQPEELRRFMGRDDSIPAKDGVSLQIMLSDQDNSTVILSRLAQELHMEFSVLGGKMERYQSHHLGTLVLNFQEDDAAGAKDYLDKNNITWHPYIELIEAPEGEE